MNNSLIIDFNSDKQTSGNVISDIFNLPSWEIVKSVKLKQNSFFLFNKELSVNLLHKLYNKNSIDKYSIRTLDGEMLANIDLKIYKDCVYIVNIEINENKKLFSAVDKLIQTAIDLAFYNTSNKEVIINISSDWQYKRKIKKILLSKKFELEKHQSNYEKQMLGELYILKMQK